MPRNKMKKTGQIKFPKPQIAKVDSSFYMGFHKVSAASSVSTETLDVTQTEPSWYH